eukprot:183201_1
MDIVTIIFILCAIFSLVFLMYILYKKHIGFYRNDIPIEIFKQNDLNVFINNNRFLIVGCPAVGKTTLCKQLCDKYSKLKHIELDHLYWEKHWKVRNGEHFRMLIKQRMKRSKNIWIIDGNYLCAKELLWSNTQVVIWLEFEFWEVYYRGWKRTIKRIITKEKVCNNNTETFSQVLRGTSIPYWVWRVHGEFRDRIPRLLRKYPHIKLIKIPSPRHCEYWLSNLKINDQKCK